MAIVGISASTRLHDGSKNPQTGAQIYFDKGRAIPAYDGWTPIEVPKRGTSEGCYGGTARGDMRCSSVGAENEVSNSASGVILAQHGR
jgi:hypothetical protein